ncbi:MAG: SulP family inorganic anion transporter [Verrucomicrobiota bacterium]
MKLRSSFSWISVQQPIRDFFDQFSIEWFPSLNLFKYYVLRDFKKDWIAGLNVAALAFAQGMACALIAGLPIEYGIYGAIVAPIFGGLFSGSKNTVLGPTNATAILLLSGFMSFPAGVDRTAVICLMVFLVGLFQVIGASLQIASLTRFISRSVIVGYVTAASLLIAMNQLHRILGYSLIESSTFLGIARQTFRHIEGTNLAAILTSLFTAITYLGIRSRLRTIPAAATALAFASFFGWILSFFHMPLICLNSVDLTEFRFHFPHFSAHGVNAVASSALAIAFLSMLENTFMAKSLGNRTGTPVDVHQEFYALGVANIACSLTGGMVASGSVTRSGLNWKSGAATMMSGVMSGLFCLIGFALLGNLIRFTPTCALATLVTIVALNVIDFHAIKTCLRATKSDATVFLVTLIVALLTPLSFAIFMGVTTSVILFLRKAATPKLSEYHFDNIGMLREIHNLRDRDHPQISIIHVEGDLFFGASDVFRDEIGQVCQDPLLKVVVIRLKNARHLDASSVMALEDLLDYLNKSNRFMIISGVNRETYHVFRRSGFLFRIGKGNIFREVSNNPSLATKRALQQAMSLIGEERPIIRIFGDSNGPQDSMLSYDI